MGDKASKYLFNNRDFSDQAIAAEIKAQKNAPPQTFSEAQLEILKKRAFQEGFNQAVLEEKATKEAHLVHVFDEIKRHIDVLITSETVRSARFEKEAVHVAMAMMTHIYPVLQAHCADDQLMNDLTHILEKNRDQDAIALKVHPEMMELVQNRFAAWDAITIESDPSLGVSDANLSWPNGGVDINRDAMASQLDTLISELLHGKATPDAKPLEIDNTELMHEAKTLDADQEAVGDNSAVAESGDSENSPDQSGKQKTDLDVE